MVSLVSQRNNLFYFVLLSQATVNAATFISIPLLALYLTKEMGYTIYAMGAVLTTLLVFTRLSPLFTGAFADKYGYKRFVIGGLFIRFVGFVFLHYSSPSFIFSGVALIGLGGSLYESGTYGYLAQVNKIRSDAFYLNNQALNLGVIVGPLLAFFIPHEGYGTFFWASSIVFLLLMLVNILAFPEDHQIGGGRTRLSFAQLLADFYTDKRFLLFNVICVPWWFLFSQLYVLLPLAFSKKINGEGNELSIYLINGVVGILLTLLLLRKINSHSPIKIMVVGHLVLAFSYIIPIVSSSMLSFLIMVVVFSIAETLIMPSIDTFVAQIAPSGREANYFGIANIPWIIGATAGNISGAALLESSNPSTPWIVLSTLAIIGAGFLLIFGSRIQSACRDGG